MKLSKVRKDTRIKNARRMLLGLLLGAAVGLIASSIAGSSGSQCMILCNQKIAIPYFAAMGILVTWR
jgi:hypothetical protein